MAYASDYVAYQSWEPTKTLYMNELTVKKLLFSMCSTNQCRSKGKITGGGGTIKEMERVAKTKNYF